MARPDNSPGDLTGLLVMRNPELELCCFHPKSVALELPSPHPSMTHHLCALRERNIGWKFRPITFAIWAAVPSFPWVWAQEQTKLQWIVLSVGVMGGSLAIAIGAYFFSRAQKGAVPRPVLASRDETVAAHRN
jgi:hypothetical protein